LIKFVNIEPDIDKWYWWADAPCYSLRSKCCNWNVL